ncbi:MAG: tetratricopeptide repeat protein [Alphaproteobacteria bacterium]
MFEISGVKFGRAGGARGLVAALAVTALVACSSPEERAEQHFERALAHVEAGNDAKAMIELRNVLRIEPENAEALYEVGRLHQRAERWPQAMEAYRAAAAERPGYVDANMARGELALLGDAVDDAEDAAAAILEHHPDHLGGRTLEAAVMLRRDRTDAALAAAEAIVDEDASQENAIAVVVGALVARGDDDAAAERLDAALARLDDSVVLRRLRIALHQRAGDVEGARRMYGELVALEPENVRHRLALAEFLTEEDQAGAAESVLREALGEVESGSDAGAALVGLIYREQGADAAEAELERLIERHPQEMRYRFLLADLATRDGRIDAAESALRGVVDTAGDDATVNDAKAALARLSLGAEELESAKSLADEVLADDDSHRAAHFVRGLVHLAEDDPGEALRNARGALERDRRWTPGLKLLAEAHLRRGETELAVSTLRDVTELDPTDAGAAELLATLLTRRGDLDSALEVWDRLVEDSERADRARLARAQIRMSQENWSAAEADIRRLLETPERQFGGTVLAGSLDLARERHEDSRDWFGKALEMEPGSNEAVAGLVQAYVAEGDLDAAVAFLQERTAARSQDAFAFRLKGELLARQGELDAAIAAYERTVELAPEWVRAHRELAALHRRGKEDAEAAIAVYRDALGVMPEQPVLLDELGQSLVLAGRHEAAMEVYEKLIELEPKNDVAANNFAALVADHAYADEARLANALEVADRFRASNDGLFLDTLGWLHYRDGDYPTAATFLNRAVAAEPERADLRYHLGMALERTGDTEGALEHLRRAVAAEVPFDGVEEAKRTLDALEAETAATIGDS